MTIYSFKNKKMLTCGPLLTSSPVSIRRDCAAFVDKEGMGRRRFSFPEGPGPSETKHEMIREQNTRKQQLKKPKEGKLHKIKPQS